MPKKILITGGADFVGKHVVAKLQDLGVAEESIILPSKNEFNFLNSSDVSNLLQLTHPDIIIHLPLNSEKNQTEIFYESLIADTQLIEQARLHKVKKFIALGTIQSYSQTLTSPLKEENIWNLSDLTEENIYGLAKKIMLLQLKNYKQQYDFNSLSLIPTIIYGPGDSFESSNIVSFIIKKIIDSQQKNIPSVEVFHQPTSTQDFLYVEDAAEGIVSAMVMYDKQDPVNLGTGKEISIKDLAQMIARLVGYTGTLVWNSSKPDGQPSRCLDVSKAKQEFGFEAKMSLEDGLRKTIDWYKTTLLNPQTDQAKSLS